MNSKVCLNDLLTELQMIFEIKPGNRVSGFYSPKDCLMRKVIFYSDETKLNKILGNLLENALKFTRKGYIEIGYKLERTNLEIYVKDTGIGIAPEKQTVIFERFSQEDKDASEAHSGLGLGLSIAKENSELMGGQISLSSEKNKGSIFTVTIPYKPANGEENT